MTKLNHYIIAICMIVAMSYNIAAQASTAMTYSEPKSKATLKGTWTADAKALMESEEVFEGLSQATITLTFSKKAALLTLDLSGDIKGDDATFSMELGIKASAKMNYKRSGDKLNFTTTDEKPTMELYKFKINGSEDALKMLNILGLSEEVLKKQFEEGVSIDYFNELNGDVTITTLTEDTLVLTDNKNKALTFNRVK